MNYEAEDENKLHPKLLVYFGKNIKEAEKKVKKDIRQLKIDCSDAEIFIDTLKLDTSTERVKDDRIQYYSVEYVGEVDF